MDGKGKVFTCHGYDNGNWCHHDNLGTVTNDETSAVDCSCPVEFIRIEYDMPNDITEEKLVRDDNSVGHDIDSIVVNNMCDPTKLKCEAQEGTLSNTVKST